jgi:hypothetical protein
MKKIVNLFFLLIVFQLFSQKNLLNEQLIIVPEKSNFEKTSSYADVMLFINEIQNQSKLVHLEFMGRSVEGNEIPVVILANPKISSPDEAIKSGKPVMYVQGNIHAGEVEGKEVLQQLMRDILIGDKSHLLTNQIIIFAPIYNTDSNDKMEKGRRPSQEDSPIEVGVRENSQGLDLNRDGIKMEAIETESLVTNVLLKWNPEILVDLHTTNGTWHGYGITYAPSYHYAGEKGPYNFTWDRMLPEITKEVDKNYDVKIGPYGYYFMQQGWPPNAIYTYNHHPRYLVNQMGLRNKIGILSEAFAHDRFYKRINGTYAFVAEILEFTNINGKEITTINTKAEFDAIENVKRNAGKVTKGVQFKKAPLNEKIENYRTYDYIPFLDESGKQQFARSGKIIEVPNVENFSKFESIVESKLPRGYFLPKNMESIVTLLKKHGVKVVQLNSSKKVKGEIFIVEKLNKAEKEFEGHFMATVEGKFISKTETFNKGDYWIDMAQPLTNLIFYMLEPQSDDGLLTWNFFDTYFYEQGIKTKPVSYPVFKCYMLP